MLRGRMLPQVSVSVSVCSNAAWAVVIAVGLASCQQPSQPVTAPTVAGRAPATAETHAPPPSAMATIDTPPPPVPGSSTDDDAAPASGFSTGVKECDDYLAALLTCGKDPTVRAALKPAIEQMTKSWSQLAADPANRAALAGACKSAMASIPSSAVCH
jgi:hypothetical protein